MSEDNGEHLKLEDVGADLENVGDAVEPSSTERVLSNEEVAEGFYSDIRTNHEIQREALRLADLRLTLELRSNYGRNLFGLLVGWIVVVTLTVWMAGCSGTVSVADRRFEMGFELSDPVLIAMLSTTTINVIGLVWVVANHLFPASK